jgi:hypothetical protein
VISKVLSPILPQGEIWTVHFVAGLSLMFSLTAYVVYIARSGLAERNAARRIKAVTLRGSSPAARKARWGAVNIALHWFMYGIVVVMTATGIALYLGFGGWVVSVHAACALICLAYIFVHITTHALYGGWNQICAYSGRPASSGMPLKNGHFSRRRWWPFQSLPAWPMRTLPRARAWPSRRSPRPQICRSAFRIPLGKRRGPSSCGRCKA